MTWLVSGGDLACVCYSLMVSLRRPNWPSCDCELSDCLVRLVRPSTVISLCVQGTGQGVCCSTRQGSCSPGERGVVGLMGSHQG